jgi:alpha-1,4-digalacturonate transport system permease protein
MTQVTTGNDRFKRFVEENSSNQGGNRISRLLYWLAFPIILVSKILLNVVGIVLDRIQQIVGLERMAYVFILPNLLIFGIFVLFPMMLNFYYAFTGGTRIFPEDRAFVGMENFAILADCGNYLDPNTCAEDTFWRAIGNTFFFVVFQVTGMVLFSMITALALNQKIVLRGFFRSVFFYPVLLSPVVVGLIWRWILLRNGALNAVITGAGGDVINFTISADWMRFWVIFITIWAQMGFYTLILLAGLQAIPPELYEAGQIDGTTKLESFRFITLPLLMPTMFVVVVLALIRAVQVFDQVFVLTGGGPGTATTYIVQYIYETAFAGQTRLFGLAAAASVSLGVVLFVFTMLQLYLGRRQEAA